MALAQGCPGRDYYIYLYINSLDCFSVLVWNAWFYLGRWIA